MNHSTEQSTAFILDINKLQPGDIILTKDDHKVSKAIRAAIGGNFSHAILYVGSSYIESTRNGVHSNNPQRLLFASRNDCKVLRYNKVLSSYKLNDIISFARLRIGTSYSIPEAVRSGPLPQMPIPVKENRQFCSRLVAQAYHSVGINIVKNPNFSSPEAINKSPLLVEVKDCLREATEKEIEFATATENTPLLKQQAITNGILEEARKISGEDIQTLVQLEDLVRARPELDGRIAYVLKKSGYLTMWQDEIKKNSWRYDYDTFVIDIPDSERRKRIAHNEINDATDMRMRYGSGLKMYTDAYDSAPSITLELLLNLSKELVHMSTLRDAVIKRVLE